ncbi:MAG: hypothetical protein SGBAC_005684 [Bacillariaceae sp.]
MTTSLHDSIASLDLASLHTDDIVDICELDLEVMEQQEKTETVSRQDLMSSFSKFDSLVSFEDFPHDKDDDGSVDTVNKFLHHYESAHHDITADLRAFQSNIETVLPEKEKKKRKKKKGLGKKKQESRRKSVERKHSPGPKIEETHTSPVTTSDEPPAKINITSPAAVQDLPRAPTLGGKDDLTGMTILTGNPPSDPQSASPPEPTPALPDPSTMSAKEILAELNGHSSKNMNFIEKSEMIEALRQARLIAKTSTKEKQKAPSTPRGSRSRGRSAEPSPRCRTMSPLRAHLNSLIDLMELELEEGKVPTTHRKRKKGIKKVRSRSTGAFEVSPVQAQALKRSISWWKMGDTDENSKNSKESKNSKRSKSSQRRKGLRKSQSSNAIDDFDDDIVAARDTFAKSKANSGWNETPKRENRTVRRNDRPKPTNTLGMDGGQLKTLKKQNSWWNLSSAEETSKSSKESKNSRQKKGMRKTQSSNAIGGIDDDINVPKSKANAVWDLTQTPGRRRKKALRRLSSDRSVGIDRNDDGSKRSKESRNSGRKKGLRKSSSVNKLNIDEIVIRKSKKNKSLSPMRKCSSNPTLDTDIPSTIFAKSKANSTWDIGAAGSKKKRSKSLRRSNSNPTLGIDPYEDDSSKKSKGSGGRKKGLKKSRSGTKLDIDALLTGRSKKKRSVSLRGSCSNPTLCIDPYDEESSERKKGLRKASSGNNLDIDAILIGKSKKKRSISLRVSNSKPTLGIDPNDDDGTKRSKDSSGRKKGLRKASSGNNLDIGGILTGKSKKHKNLSPMRRCNSNPTIDANIPRTVFAKSKANSTWDLGSESGSGGSQYKEKQTVLYTSSNGEMEEAVILKVYLDDSLVPFYDIKLSNSGKEKQTDDNHLSATQSLRRRLKKQQPLSDPDVYKSPVTIRPKLSKLTAPQSTPTVRKAFRVL